MSIDFTTCKVFCKKESPKNFVKFNRNDFKVRGKYGGSICSKDTIIGVSTLDDIRCHQLCKIIQSIV
ncbi:hypothetical protein CVS40_12554 [Lucilia cuprina]|nr:hypothetical protein CVS40_12554 [Lucilia cuprina]